MIKIVQLTRFKKYKTQTFRINPRGVSLLVGGNNSGKSTLIHALSIWEFCKLILSYEKGEEVFNVQNFKSYEGLGMSSEEFLPLALPSLNHLWTNLKTQLSQDEKEKWPDNYPGYNLRIKYIWDYQEQSDRMVEIGLSLANDRLFIRVTNTNLHADDYIPAVVYLPTFAGVLPKESLVTRAERKAYLGRGMAGSILRNMIYDLYIEEQRIKDEITSGDQKTSRKVKQLIKESSPLEKLNSDLREVFSTELEVANFSDEFHTILHVYERKGMKNEAGKFETFPKSKYNSRDIVSQGSGFLQWLSIFCVLYGQKVDILLLDEPDAHLHASLQNELLQRLIKNGDEKATQILISTHSVEIIKSANLIQIYSMDTRRYLFEEASRVSVLSGIGSEYFPRLDLLKRYKRVIFIENESDRKILSILSEKCGIYLSSEIVFWPTTDSHSIRRHLFDELQKIIPDLKGISLRDRDMEEPDAVGEGLIYKTIALSPNSPLKLLQWRRKNIESYLLCPKAIALASRKEVEEIRSFFMENHALAISDDGYIEANPPNPIILCDGKIIFTMEGKGIQCVYNCDKYDVAKNMTAEEVCADIKTFLTEVHTHFFHRN